MITGSFTIIGIEDAQQDVITVSPKSVTVSAYNIQRDPLVIKIRHLTGVKSDAMKAYVHVRIMSADIELGKHDFGLCSEASYTLPSSKWGNATRIVVEAFTDEAHKNIITSEDVSIVAENPIPFPIGDEWGAGYRYKNGEYLLVGNTIYMWKNRVTGNTLSAPGKVLSSDPFNGSWQEYKEWPLLATQMFLAKSALIGSSVFDGDFTISQHGKSNDINPDTGKPYDYRYFGKKDGNGNDLFTPNFMVDWLSGKVAGKDIDMQGGNIGGFELTGFNLRNKNGKDCWVSIQTSDGDNTRISSLGNCFPSTLGYSVAGYYESSGTSTNKALVLRAFGSKNPVGISDKFENHCIDAIGGVNWHMDGKDHWCMPGVLYAAHFGGGGELYEYWGDGVEIKVENVGHPSTGTYSITHDIGHMSYFVAITPMRNWTFATLQHKNANSFGFTIADANRGLIDSEFDLVIFGRPFVKNK